MRKTIIQARIDERQRSKRPNVPQTRTITFWGRTGNRVRNKLNLRLAVDEISHLRRAMRYRRLTPEEEDDLARCEEVVRRTIRADPELVDPYRAWLILNGFHKDRFP